MKYRQKNIITKITSTVILTVVLLTAGIPVKAADYNTDAEKLNVEINTGADLSSLAAACGGEIVRTGPLNYVTLQFKDNEKKQILQKVLAQPGVLAAEWSKEYQISAPDVNSTASMETTSLSYSEPQYSEQWALKKIRANQVWDEGVTGEGVTVAVIDTGVDLDFPDLVYNSQSNLVDGYNAITRSTEKNSVQDDNGHGTSVAGLIAALNNNLGIIGIAYHAKIMPIKAMDKDGKGDDAVIADAIIWAADHGAKIINMSLGSSSETKILDDALAYAAAKGCLLIGASGNIEGSGAPIASAVNYPAADENVIAVSAVDSNDKIAGFALTGPEIRLTAPGVKIITDIWTKSDTGVGYMSGTSIAAPFVSGAAALLWSKYPSQTAAGIRQALVSSAYDLGSQGRDDNYGYGRVDVYRALKTLQEQKTFSSPAALGWEGGRIFLAGTSGEEPAAVLTIPAGAFSFKVDAAGSESKINFALETAVSPAGFPPGIVPASAAVAVKPWGESLAEKPLRLELKLNPPESKNTKEEIAYLYQWSGSRWIRAGGGFSESSSSIAVTVYEPGTYRAGWSAVSDGERISGSDRIRTALEIAREAFPTGTDTVILTREDSYPDALAGVPLAYRYHAPILLTDPNSLPVEVNQLIKDLAPKKIIILGGTKAVASSVETALQNIAYVTRIAGDNRYATAAAIAGILGTKGRAVVVNGANFPDAIAMASSAAQTGTPILLTPAGNLNESAADTLRKLSVVSTEVIGGSGVISPAVYSQLPDPARLSGNDRYATSAAVVEANKPQGEILYVATGLNFPDALTGGILAAVNSSAILLLSPQGLTDAQTRVLQTISGKKVVALGGQGAVSDQVLAQVKALVK